MIIADPAVLANTILPKTTLKDDWERDIAPSVPPGLLHPEWAGTRLDTVRFVPQVWDRNTDNAVDQAMTNLSAHATSIGSQALYDPNSLQSRRKVGMMDKVVHSIKTSVALETAGHTEDHPLRYLRDKLNTKLDKTFHPPVKMSDTGYQDRSASGWSRAVNKGVMYEDITQLEEADLNFVIENLAMAEKRSGK
jgi:hypothetical protein